MIGQTDELLGGLNRLGDLWEWYFAAEPSVARGVQHFFQREILDRPQPVGEPIWLDAIWEVPTLGKDLGTGWEQAEHPDYKAIHWSTSHYPKLCCNGIRIGSPSSGIDQQQLPAAGVEVVDTVGAGDCFTAAMIIRFLKGRPLREINRNAN